MSAFGISYGGEVNEEFKPLGNFSLSSFFAPFFFCLISKLSFVFVHLIVSLVMSWHSHINPTQIYHRSPITPPSRSFAKKKIWAHRKSLLYSNYFFSDLLSSSDSFLLKFSCDLPHSVTIVHSMLANSGKVTNSLLPPLLLFFIQFYPLLMSSHRLFARKMNLSFFLPFERVNTVKMRQSIDSRQCRRVFWKRNKIHIWLPTAGWRRLSYSARQRGWAAVSVLKNEKHTRKREQKRKHIVKIIVAPDATNLS